MQNKGYIVVTDYVQADGKTDVTAAVQRLIDENPNRTIYFPDGTYLISEPLCTPAHPSKSVDLQLSNYAVIKAADNWNNDEAMIRLGAKDPANDIFTVGSNYSFTGGVVDGSNKASGISIDGGRETAIRNVSLKHVRIGVHVKHGANSGSSDADISDVNIIGTRTTDSVGVLLEGFDNTLTNMRIAHVQIGVHMKSGGNIMRNIHPLYTLDYTDYENSCGFLDEDWNNWHMMCYSDHFGVGFRRTKNTRSIYDNCFCMWYAGKGKAERQVVFQADDSFCGIVNRMTVGFHADAKERVMLCENTPGGSGCFDQAFINHADRLDEADAYKKYIR